MDSSNALTIEEGGTHPLRDELLRQSGWESNLDACYTCGKCLSVCPLHGWGDLDPRMVVRKILLGFEKEVVDDDWIFQCTGCDRCSKQCPMEIKMSNIITLARSLRARDAVPGGSQKTCDLHRNVGNNMSLSEEDWLETVDWMREEAEAEWPGLDVPIDIKGAKYYMTINSKLPQYHPMDLQMIYRIFHAAGVSWTMPKLWWEGTNYAMFSGDLDTWEHTLRKQVENVEALGCEVMAYTECGHGYYATLAGYRKFGIEPKFEIVHKVNLYAQWIREGRIKVDKSKNTAPITIHDPCNAVRKSEMNGFPSIADDLRYVVGEVCENVIEMWPNRDHNYCCSGGGGLLISGFAKSRYHQGRPKVEQIDRTGAELVCTPCVNCFDGIGDLAHHYKRPWKSIHLWELVSEALVVPQEDDR
ncbi:MAG: (Fe-S)-binding protein [Deltaproteobacteria bacterium]|nr:(Fe-S)-binding protein [Deltaproteobacteria bacterium]